MINGSRLAKACMFQIALVLVAGLTACQSGPSEVTHKKDGTVQVNYSIPEEQFQKIGNEELERRAIYECAKTTIDEGGDYFKPIRARNINAPYMDFTMAFVTGAVLPKEGPGGRYLIIQMLVAKEQELPPEQDGFIDAHQVLGGWPDLEGITWDLASLPDIQSENYADRDDN